MVLTNRLSPLPCRYCGEPALTDEIIKLMSSGGDAPGTIRCVAWPTCDVCLDGVLAKQAELQSVVSKLEVVA